MTARWPINVIGIDPGLNHLGIAWSTGHTRTIHPQAGPRDHLRRADQIDQHIRRVLTSGQPHLVVIEGPIPLSNRDGHSGARRLNDIRFLAALAAWRHGAPSVEIHPSTLKAWIARISGKADSKDDSMTAAYTLGGAPSTDHEADAYLLRAAALRHYLPLDHCDWPELTDGFARVDWPAMPALLEGST